jgi:hypothetical protein
MAEGRFWSYGLRFGREANNLTSENSIQNVPGGKVNILGGHSIGHYKQKNVYVHVSYSERFPR